MNIEYLEKTSKDLRKNYSQKSSRLPEKFRDVFLEIARIRRGPKKLEENVSNYKNVSNEKVSNHFNVREVLTERRFEVETFEICTRKFLGVTEKAFRREIDQ